MARSKNPLEPRLDFSALIAVAMRRWFVPLLCSVAVLLLPRLAQGQTSTIDFEQFAGPNVFQTADPPLMAASATITGGELLRGTTFLPADQTTVYGTASFCSGCLPTITIQFNQPVSNFSVFVINGEPFEVTYTVQDDQGGLQTQSFPGNSDAGAGTINLPSSNILQVTITSNDSSNWDFFIDNVSFTPAIAAIDPVPGLLNGNTLVTDPESLATLGTVVSGAAADSAARVVLRVPAATVGDNLTITVMNDQGQPSTSTQQDGTLATVAGVANPGPLVVPVVNTNEGPMGFAVYLPPVDFSRGAQDDNAAQRSISFQVVESPSMNTAKRSDASARRSHAAQTNADASFVDSAGGRIGQHLAPATNPPAQTGFKIIRPPVVLVHGLWGDPPDWDGFTALTNDPMKRFFVRLASFNSPVGSGLTASVPGYTSKILATAKQNTLGFAYNAPSVLMQINQFINEFKNVNNVVATQADVVGHSMGSVITRTLTYLPDYTKNNPVGLVHKLITVDGTHLGTQMAPFLLAANNTCTRNLLAEKGNIAFQSVTLGGQSVSGGAGDLQGNGIGGNLSAALKAIQAPNANPLPTALIAGTINATNLAGLNCTFCAANYIRNKCAGDPLADALTATGWPTVFGGNASDAIVPLTSELANLTGTTFDGAVHSPGLIKLSFAPPDVLHLAAVPTKVIDLLNESITGPDFHPLP
jgi:pimeloyl-ACP methyl ester carboxylesterase